MPRLKTYGPSCYKNFVLCGKQVTFILDSVEGKLITRDTTARHISSMILILNGTRYAADNWRSVIQYFLSSCGFISDISALQQDSSKMKMRDVTVVNKHKAKHCIA